MKFDRFHFYLWLRQNFFLWLSQNFTFSHGLWFRLISRSTFQHPLSIISKWIRVPELFSWYYHEISKATIMCHIVIFFGEDIGRVGLACHPVKGNFFASVLPSSAKFVCHIFFVGLHPDAIQSVLLWLSFISGVGKNRTTCFYSVRDQAYNCARMFKYVQIIRILFHRKKKEK